MSKELPAFTANIIYNCELLIIQKDSCSKPPTKDQVLFFASNGQPDMIEVFEYHESEQTIEMVYRHMPTPEMDDDLPF